MLKKTTISLGWSILGSSVIGVIIAIFIVMSFGSIGSRAVTTTSSSTYSASYVSSSAATSSATSGVSSAVSGSSAVSSGTSSSVQVALPVSEGGIISSTAGRAIMGLICILIFLSLIYSTAWKEGNRDPNRVKYGHMKKFMAKGFVAGLLAAIPYFIITTLFVVSQLSSPNDTFGIVMNIIYRFTNIQYIVFNDSYVKYPVYCYLLLLLLPAAAEIGYLAGYRNLVLLTKIIYKNPKKKDGTYRKSVARLKR